jgi:prevent-host-death family protein
MMSIITVGTRELKNRLSEYMRRVKAGETVIITERGKPVGKITPIQADLTDRLKQFAEAGIIDWNGQAVPPYQTKVANNSQHLLSDLVVEDRE